MAINDTVLICEDEEDIRKIEVLNLQRAGFNVIEVGSGEEAIEAYNQHAGEIAVAVLDIMLPGIDGFTVCETIRQKDPAIGIIMLSAKGEEMDKVKGLMQGADDYMTKPFSFSELTARIDAVTRRVHLVSNDQKVVTELTSGPFVLNIRSHSLTKNGNKIDLTQVEFQLMEQLIRNPNVALERISLLNSVWGDDYFGDDKIVDVNVRRLRMKIEDDPSEPKYLTTVWGFGYKWVE